jgi:hypothetical protein
MFFYRAMHPQDFQALSDAIRCWYSHFGIPTTDRDTSVLCSAALDLFNDGRRDARDLGAGLREIFPDPVLMKQNARSSQAVH